jgi:hypothetical protein
MMVESANRCGEECGEKVDLGDSEQNACWERARSSQVFLLRAGHSCCERFRCRLVDVTTKGDDGDENETEN